MVNEIRRSIGAKRVGHTGTLDPFATGLLVVLIGRATRLSQYLVGLDKEYVGTIRFGEATETDDITGDIVASSDSWRELTNEKVQNEMNRFIRRFEQTPPIYSAKKIGGERAYKLARRGEEVKLSPKEIEVFRWKLEGMKAQDVQFSCKVSSGTYIRSLARDLGESLDCPAHLAELRRTSVGEFNIEDANTLNDIADGQATLYDPVKAVGHLPCRYIDDEKEKSSVVHGKPIPAADEEENAVAVVSNDRLIAIAVRRNGMLRPKVVLER